MKVFKSDAGRLQVMESYDKIAALWDVSKEEKYIDTRFGRTHIFLTGDKSNPPLLLFHGVGDNSAVMWILNIKELSKHFYCIAIDTLGGPGKSEPNAHFNKKEFRQAEWINELTDQLKLNRFYIAGVSYGACMAYQYTVQERERVIRTVCIEGGMIINPMKSAIKTLMLAFPEVLFPTRENMIKIMMKMKPGSDLFEKHPEIVDHMILVMKNHYQPAMFPHRLEKYDREMGMAARDRIYFLLGSKMLAE